MKFYLGELHAILNLFRVGFLDEDETAGALCALIRRIHNTLWIKGITANICRVDRFDRRVTQIVKALMARPLACEDEDDYISRLNRLTKIELQSMNTRRV